jgi:hypothetical protein
MSMSTTPESASAQEALSKLVEWCDRNDWGTVPDKLEAMCRNALLSESGTQSAGEPRAYLFNGHAFTPNLLTSDQRARAVPLYASPSASGAVEALRECRAYFERELADDQTLIDGDFGKAYRLTVAALAATESRSKE